MQLQHAVDSLELRNITLLAVHMHMQRHLRIYSRLFRVCSEDQLVIHHFKRKFSGSSPGTANLPLLLRVRLEVLGATVQERNNDRSVQVELQSTYCDGRFSQRALCRVIWRAHLCCR